MGLINKSAGVLAPLLFTALILSDINASAQLAGIHTQELAHKLIKPYMAIGVILFLLTLYVWFSSLPELEFEDDPYDDENIFAFPRVVLGALALFFYVGIEVIAGDTIGLYGQSLGIANATVLTAYTMGFMVVGYLVGVFFIPKFVSQEKALVFSAIFGMLFLLGVAFGSTTESHIISELPDSVVFVAMLGLANALVWPTIWPLALQDLGKHTAKGSALLIMAISGGAVLPLVFGKVAQITANMQMAYLVGIVCYVMILLYRLKWHKMTGWRV
jgi:fucose permease